MKSIIEGNVVKTGYVGWKGWTEETRVEINEYNTFEEVIEKFEGKKVKITIQEIK